MTDTVIVALISVGGPLLVAATAVILNCRGFALIHRGLDRIEGALCPFRKRREQRF